MSWLEDLRKILKERDIDEEHHFLKTFVKSLTSHTGVRPGDRTAIPVALECGLDQLFSDCKWLREECSETLLFENQKKRVDRAYRKDNSIIYVEVKSTFEFNAISAAMIEALLFKRVKKNEDAKFLLVSLCTKINDPVGFANVLTCNIGSPGLFDGVFVLVDQRGAERNGDDFFNQMAAGVERLSNWIANFNQRQ